jgi:dihydrofolate reductase
MRKLIVGGFVSLDGVVDKPWEWVGPYFDEQNKGHAFANLAGIDLFLLGRITYERFSSTWANIKGDEYFDKINSMPKIVASNTLKEATWNSTIIEGDIATEIAMLKEQPGKNILKYGIGTLDQPLLIHGLIDEFQLWIIPITVRSGRRIFENVDTTLFKLRLTNTKRFDNGVVILTYVPDKS